MAGGAWIRGVGVGEEAVVEGPGDNVMATGDCMTWGELCWW